MRIFFAVVFSILLSSCVRNKTEQTAQNAGSSNNNAFEVSEVLQAKSYTYLKVKENDSERWLAVSKQEVETGEIYYYDEALQMMNFSSKELDRTFDEIYFVNKISKTPFGSNDLSGSNDMMGQMPSSHGGKVEPEKKSNISLPKADNEITVAQIFSNREEFSGEKIEIRGVVAKVNKNIMGKNWVHLQDGTNSDGHYDLTITTQDLVKVNDEVIFEGTITLEKDFGSGYFYEVIMENAGVVNNQKVNL